MKHLLCLPKDDVSRKKSPCGVDRNVSRVCGSFFQWDSIAPLKNLDAQTWEFGKSFPQK